MADLGGNDTILKSRDLLATILSEGVGIITAANYAKTTLITAMKNTEDSSPKGKFAKVMNEI